MTRHVKAASAGSTRPQASPLGGIFRGALATTAAPFVDGSGAPSGRRSAVRLALLALASVMAMLAFATPASAAAPTGELTSITAGFTKVHGEGTVHPNTTEAEICWMFQYGDKEQVDNAPHELNEEWQHGESGCFYAEKDEPHPVSFDNYGVRPSEKWYGRLHVWKGEERTNSPRVEFETKHVNTPITTIDAVTEVTTNSATFYGTVNPNAPQEASKMTDEEEKQAYRTEWEFRCEPGCNVYEVNGNPGNGGVLDAENSDLVTPVSFVAKANNLESNRTFTVYMNALNPASDYYDYLTKAGKMTFKTFPIPPEVTYLDSAPVNTVRTTSARLVALVDKKNSPLTQCYFEYGTTTEYGTTVPCGADRAGVPMITADVLGLEPDTTYHFRVVTANAVGPDIGADRTFTTLALPESPLSCTNAAIRTEQRASPLNRCRAWEMVSPIDKNGGNVMLENGAAAAARTGDAIAYFSRGSFADTEGAGAIGTTEYVARRGASGWETHALLPTPATETAQTGFFPGNSIVFQFSDDLSKGLLNAYDLPKVADDIEVGMNMYVVDTETRATETITKPVAGEVRTNIQRKLEYNGVMLRSGASADMSVVSFVSRTPLLPEAPENTTSLYEWDSGELRLASYLPNGEPATEVEAPRVGFTSVESMSRDGSMTTFLASKEGSTQLYLRRNHTDTVWVSEPEGSNESNPENVKFEYFTLDEEHILFNTTSPLLDEDTNGDFDLYMYEDSPDPDSESNLTMISSGQFEAANSTESVLGTSDDGSYVYYQDTKWGLGQILQWHEGQRKVVLFPYGGSAQRGLNVDPGSVRVSRDGKRLVTINEAPPYSLIMGEGYGLNGVLTKGKAQLWIYDDPTETTLCASCPNSPVGQKEIAPKTGTTVVPEVLKEINIQMTLPNRARYMTEDGKLAFFSTLEALVPEDKNGIMDVYEYDIETGHLHLVSSGQGEWGSWFVDASANGDDVFIGTREKLINADKDTLADIYDARVQGGYPEPPPAPTACVGDACRGPIPAAPADLSPATPRFAGPGDPAPKHLKNKKGKNKKGKKRKNKKGKNGQRKAKRGQARGHRGQGGAR